jgi:hypothetical protein
MDATGQAACAIEHRAIRDWRSSRDEAFIGLRATRVDSSRGIWCMCFSWITGVGWLRF